MAGLRKVKKIIAAFVGPPRFEPGFVLLRLVFSCGPHFKTSLFLHGISFENTARYATHLQRIAISFEHSVTMDINTNPQTLCTVSSVLLAQSLSFFCN
jgi:hypothetical protein